jgi:hypothetical protein
MMNELRESQWRGTICLSPAIGFEEVRAIRAATTSPRIEFRLPMPEDCWQTYRNGNSRLPNTSSVLQTAYRVLPTVVNPLSLSDLHGN